MAIMPLMIFLYSGFGKNQECVLISVIHRNHIAVETSKIVAVKRVLSCFLSSLKAGRLLKTCSETSHQSFKKLPAHSKEFSLVCLSVL